MKRAYINFVHNLFSKSGMGTIISELHRNELCEFSQRDAYGVSNTVKVKD